MTALLKQLSIDIDAGLLVSLQNAARTETLDDLLDQAASYHDQDHKEGAGILATAVFEDTVRRLARTNSISEAGRATDTIISELSRKGVITAVIAKRCRAAAGVRNHALHAQWGDFTLHDVEEVLRLTRHLLADHLGR
jgi:uncharacterized protein YutE (UPF0331/DUF86 family)